MKQILAIFALSILVACNNSLEFSVKERWSKSIQNFAVQPVYPMREDIFVGSMRLVRKKVDPFSLGSRSLGYLALERALTDQESRLPNYPATDQPSKIEVGSNKKTERTVWKQPTNPNVFLPNYGSPERLRLAALPGVSVLRLNAADFGNRGLLAAVAGSYRQNSNLNIDLTGIESVELDDISAYKLFRNTVIPKLIQDPDYRSAICASAETLESSLENVQIQLVTRVFYARGIEYTYGNATSASLGGSKGTTGIISPVDVFKSADEDGEDESADAAAEEEIKETAAATQPKPAEAVALDSLSPGTVAKISTTRTDGSTLTEIFERPLAFGASTMAFSPAGLGLRCASNGDGLYAGTLVVEQVSDPAVGKVPGDVRLVRNPKLEDSGISIVEGSSINPLGDSQSKACKDLRKAQRKIAELNGDCE